MQFSLSHDMATLNWKTTSAKIRSIAIENQNNNLSIYGKIQLINALLLSHIIFLARIFLPSQQQINAIQHIIHKFLWFPSYLEPINRKKLIPDHRNGEIRMPDIDAKSKAAFAMKLLLVLQNKSTKHFYSQYMIYNLNRKLDHLNPDLYKHNSINRPTPNHTWQKTYDILNGILPQQNISELDFKDIYWLLTKAPPNPHPTCNSSTQPTSWLTILLRKPSPNPFTPRQRSSIPSRPQYFPMGQF